jgi:hypothetical protein
VIRLFAAQTRPVHAQIEPRTWRDVWHFQRRIRFHAVLEEPEMLVLQWVDTVQLDAGITKLQFENLPHIHMYFE